MADSFVLFANLISLAIKDGLTFDAHNLAAKLRAKNTEANKKTVTAPATGAQAGAVAGSTAVATATRATLGQFIKWLGGEIATGAELVVAIPLIVLGSQLTDAPPHRAESLPRNEHGEAVPDPKAVGEDGKVRDHTQIGEKAGRKGDYRQTREWKDGKPVKETDWTDHGRPKDHPNPHDHRIIPNPTGGTPQRGPAEPMQVPE
jgi:hypothetical protein